MTNVIIERSHRHVHLTERTAQTLFGDQELHLKPLSVLGEYVTDFYVNVPCLGKTRVLYPWRPYNQLEVAMSEYRRMMGHYTKRRNSGDVLDAAKVYTSDPYIVELPVIVPVPHVHTPSLELLEGLEGFPLDLDVRFNETVGGKAYVHLDNDAFNTAFDERLPVQWHF
jgi:propanediol utilization protein